MEMGVRENPKVKVEDLTPSLRRFDITVKVLEVGEEREVTSRRDGTTHRVADALVGDETGTVLMSLWDGDIDRMRELVGRTITLRNGYVTVYRGSMRLNKGRFGKIDLEGEVGEVNTANNISEKEVSAPSRGFRGQFYRKRRGRY